MLGILQRRCPAYFRKMTSSSSQPNTIGSVFSQSAQKNSSATALVASHQRIRLDYARLYSLSIAFASALSGLKYSLGDRIALSLKNDSENLIAQLGCSMIGVSVVTAKDTTLLAKACSELMCKGLIVDAANAPNIIVNSVLASLSHPMIVTGSCAGLTLAHLPFDELLKSPLMVPSTNFPPSTPVAYYGTTSKPVTHSDLIKAAQSVLMELRLGAWDRVCVPVTLNHTFGFGSGHKRSFLISSNP
jgi:fatty-acyl-CoA synthase